MREERKEEQLNPLFDDRINTEDLLPCLILFLIVGISNVATNSLLLHLMRKRKTSGKISSIFIICLCVSDIFMGINQILSVMFRFLMQNIPAEIAYWLEMTSFFFSYLFEPLSACLLILIATDRYIHMLHLTTYRTIMTKRRAKIATGVCLVINIFFTTAVQVAIFHEVYIILNFALSAIYTLVIMVVAILYVKTVAAIKTKVRNLSIHGSQQQQQNMPRTDRKELYRGLMWLLSSLVACYVPFIVLRMVRVAIHLESDRVDEVTVALAVAYVFKCSNATINAVLLIVFNKQSEDTYMGY